MQLLFCWVLPLGKLLVAYFCSYNLAFFSRRFVRVQLKEPYSSTDTVTDWNKSHCILSERSNFIISEKLSIATHACPLRMLTSLSIDEILMPMYVNWSTDFWSLTLKVGMALFLSLIISLSLYIYIYIITKDFLQKYFAKINTFFSLTTIILIGRFFFLFPFRYSILFNVIAEMGYIWTPVPSTPSSFPFSLSQNSYSPHIFLFLTEINPSLSGQVSDETWYTWWHLAPTIYIDSHSQNQ